MSKTRARNPRTTNGANFALRHVTPDRAVLHAMNGIESMEQEEPFGLRNGGEIHAADGFFGNLRKAMLPTESEKAAKAQYLAETRPAPAPVAPVAPVPAPAPAGGVGGYVGNSALEGRMKAAGLRDGGEIHATNGFFGNLRKAMLPTESEKAAKAQYLAETRPTVAPAPAAPASAPVGGIGGYSGNSALDGRMKAAGLRNGGDLRTGHGGLVPGKGKGDKIAAKYEPGEFVVSNAMLDAKPGLRKELRALRKEVLADKGMTVQEADAKALNGGTLRAASGAWKPKNPSFQGGDLISADGQEAFDDIKNQRAAQDSLKTTQAAPKAVQEVDDVKAALNRASPVGAPAGTPAAPAAAPTRLNSLRAGAGNVLTGAKAVGPTILAGVGGAAAASAAQDVGNPANTPALPAKPGGFETQIPTGGTLPAPAAQPYNFFSDNELGRNVGNTLNAVAPLTGGAGQMLRTMGTAGKLAPRAALATDAADAAIVGAAAQVRAGREETSAAPVTSGALPAGAAAPVAPAAVADVEPQGSAAYTEFSMPTRRGIGPSVQYQAAKGQGAPASAQPAGSGYPSSRGGMASSNADALAAAGLLGGGGGSRSGGGGGGGGFSLRGGGDAAQAIHQRWMNNRDSERERGNLPWQGGTSAMDIMHNLRNQGYSTQRAKQMMDYLQATDTNEQTVMGGLVQGQQRNALAATQAREARAAAKAERMKTQFKGDFGQLPKDQREGGEALASQTLRKLANGEIVGAETGANMHEQALQHTKALLAMQEKAGLRNDGIYNSLFGEESMPTSLDGSATPKKAGFWKGLTTMGDFGAGDYTYGDQQLPANTPADVISYLRDYNAAYTKAQQKAK